MVWIGTSQVSNSNPASDNGTQSHHSTMDRHWEDIHRTWLAKKAAFDWQKVEAKNIGPTQTELLIASIRQQRGNASDIELVNTLESVVDTEFHYAAVQSLIATFTRSGARIPLMQLLAKYCPRKEYSSDVEFWLAYQTQKTMKDGVAVLWEAYGISNCPRAKKELAEALRRGLLAMGLKSSNDDEIVKLCRQWHSVHRTHWIPNLDYADNCMHPREINDPYTKHGLFVPAH